MVFSKSLREFLLSEEMHAWLVVGEQKGIHALFFYKVTYIYVVKICLFKDCYSETF